MSAIDFYRQLLVELGYSSKGESWKNSSGQPQRLVIATGRNGHTILSVAPTKTKAWASAVHFARPG